MDWQLIVPGERDWGGVNLGGALEVRLRPGQPLWALLPEGPWRGKHVLTAEEVLQAAQALSGHGLAARQGEIAKGFLPLPGGHRLGICGRAGPEGLKEITSLCVRVAHEIKGAGGAVFPLVRGRHTLILGPPGSGKTTLLRDLARLYSLEGVQVGIADERGEIAACHEGTPQLDVGPMTDVVTGMEKGRALMLLIRSMGPQVAAADEIGGTEDARGILEAMRCGVTVLASAHGRTPEEARRRQGLSALLARGAFEKILVLTGPGQPPRLLTLRQGEE